MYLIQIEKPTFRYLFYFTNEQIFRSSLIMHKKSTFSSRGSHRDGSCSYHSDRSRHS